MAFALTSSIAYRQRIEVKTLELRSLEVGAVEAYLSWCFVEAFEMLFPVL
jgi:hypothetical protein